MITKIQPDTNWHRLLHLLEQNEGSLYRAQLYKEKKYHDPDTGTYVQHNRHVGVRTGGMPKLTSRDGMTGAEDQWETLAALLGLVHLSKWRNKKYVTILPKGTEVLRQLRSGRDWEVDIQLRDHGNRIQYT